MAKLETVFENQHNQKGNSVVAGTAGPEFPKYTTQLINLASQNAQATRPKVVGQMSELIKQFPQKHWQEWEDWYLEKHPEAMASAAEKL